MKMEKEITAWACMFSDKIIDSMVASDNQEWWAPLSIFRDPLEAARWRKEKYLGELDKTKIVKVKITTL